MLDLYRETNTEGFLALITATDLYDHYACDGVCTLLHQLNVMHGPDPDLD
jgi:hypothetical protein